MEKIKNYLAAIAACSVVLGSVYALKGIKPKTGIEDIKPKTKNIENMSSNEISTLDVNNYNINNSDANNPNINNNSDSLDNWIESKGWTITSYGHANETLSSGEKIKVFNAKGELLGLYKEDFLPGVKMNGSGVGDGIGNDKTQYLCYDYNVNDGKTYYLINHTQGAYGNIIYNWKEDRPSVAVNPILPQATKIRFKNLNLEKKLNHPWIEELLLSKTFYADDRFFLPEEERHKKKCDVYVGVIQFKDYTPDNYQALSMKDVTLLIEPPSYDLNKDGFVNGLDLKFLKDNWLKEDKTQYITGDLNYDNKIDSRDSNLFAEELKKRE